MTALDLIKVFNETQNMILNSPALFDQMVKSQVGSQLYLEGYTSPLRIAKGTTIIVL